MKTKVCNKKTGKINKNLKTRKINKNLKTIKTIKINKNFKTIKNKRGGKITTNEVLKKIISIGFEFETGNMIPVVKETYDIDGVFIEKYITDPYESHTIVTVPVHKDVNLTIVSSTDTPLLTGGVNSLMSELERRFNEIVEIKPDEEKTNKEKEEEEEKIEKINNFREFIYTYINPFDKNENENSQYNFYNHTEYIFTFLPLKPSTSINDENIILKYFDYVINYLKTSFILQDTITNEEVNSKLKTFENDGLLYLIPMTSTEDFTPSTIKWVPQMTINVKVEDVISVLEYLSKGLTTRSVDDINNCKNFAFKIIRYVTIKASENENQEKIFYILRNVVFMLVYLFVNSGDESKGTLEKGYGKNKFDFLFRCSLLRIIISLYKKYNRVDINKCLDTMKKNLEIEKTIIEKTITQKKITDFEKFYAYFACISMINFVQIITFNINDEAIKRIFQSTDIEAEFKNLYKEIRNIHQRVKTLKETEEQSKKDEELQEKLEIHLEEIEERQDISEEEKEELKKEEEEKTKEENENVKDKMSYFLSTNAFFTEIFDGASNYYPYYIENESLLIEFRSFSQNLLYEADYQVNSNGFYDVYRNLDEWTTVIEKIETKNQISSSKTRKLKN